MLPLASLLLFPLLFASGFEIELGSSLPKTEADYEYYQIPADTSTAGIANKYTLVSRKVLSVGESFHIPEKALQGTSSFVHKRDFPIFKEPPSPKDTREEESENIKLDKRKNDKKQYGQRFKYDPALIFMGLGKRKQPFDPALKYMGLGKRQPREDPPHHISSLEKRQSKYDPAMQYMGLGKRESKFDPAIRYMGLGKRESKYDPAIRYMGLGKRESKYDPAIRYMGLGKRQSKYDPAMQYMGLRKRQSKYNPALRYLGPGKREVSSVADNSFTELQRKLEFDPDLNYAALVEYSRR